MPFLAPTDTTARRLIGQNIQGPVVMLNLLRFRDVADYSQTPDLAPPAPVSGADAYALYAKGILPLLQASGGTVIYEGAASGWFIGPEDEDWDHVLLVRQSSVAAFLAFAGDPEAQRLQGHRTAALADSRLLPTRPA